VKRLMGVIGLCIVGASFGAAVIAHPGHRGHAEVSPASDHVWRSADGLVLARGTFVAWSEGMVHLRGADDLIVQVEMGRLGPLDRIRVQERVGTIRVFNQQGRRRREATPGPGRLPGDVPAGTEAGCVIELLAGDEEPLMVLAERDSRDGDVGRRGDKAPALVSAFEFFVQSQAVKTRWDKQFFYVESNGIPDHPMMVGITSWQQQVPLPQAYTGKNAWQIPLHPAPAKQPVSARKRFLRGAIALAVNGVPIFNPLNNRGDDAYLSGELDEFGGHCGRADDYHYHLAPVHLIKTIGEGRPIACALDGYPIYGFDEPDGSQVMGLDSINGHEDADGHYHYHATKTYPYLNGGFHGTIVERAGQVDPQPRAEPVRPDLRPLRGARIKEFEETRPGSYRLTYELEGKAGTVSYVVGSDGTTEFTFVDTRGKTVTESYSAKRHR
jgi:hypothetical protein